MDQIDIEKFRIETERHPKMPGSQPIPRHKLGENFLAGPIPWDWLTTAACLPGRALQIAMAIWFSVFVKKSSTVQLGSTVLRQLGVCRKSTYRGLKALEGAGLISCDRGNGRRPFITVLPASGVSTNGNGNESGSEL